MSDIRVTIGAIDTSSSIEKTVLIGAIERLAAESGYTIVERNTAKPWGAYLRIDSQQADEFVRDFFPELTPDDARRGIDGAELSPKFLVVQSGQRLSWQMHNRRAERWVFLTPGAYYKSNDDNHGELITAARDDVVQFDQGERHRLVGADAGYTIVAEIWQHTDKNALSDEDDIVRIEDDYTR